MSNTLHLCIVSERLLPNLIPVLMLRPERVLLASSEEMARRGFAQRLVGLLQGRGFAAEVREGLPSGGLGRITDFAKGWLEEVRAAHPQARVLLNVTGGNKLMAIAFVQAMGGRVDGVLYTDTANGVLEQWGASAGAESVPLSGVVDVPLYLSAQGMGYEQGVSDSASWRARADRRKRLSERLGGEAPGLGTFFGVVNALANRALDESGESLVAPRQRFQRPPQGAWRRLMVAAHEAGVVRFDGGSALELVDVESARYLGGGWLEEYAWHSARRLSPDDVRMGVTGLWEGTERGRNELDLVVVHHNRLLLIECKTLRLGLLEQKDADLLYKLDSVGERVRGLFGEVVLLSARQPSSLVMDRADHHQVRVMGPDRLGRLQEAISTWMRSGQFPAR